MDLRANQRASVSTPGLRAKTRIAVRRSSANRAFHGTIGAWLLLNSSAMPKTSSPLDVALPITCNPRQSLRRREVLRALAAVGASPLALSAGCAAHALSDVLRAPAQPSARFWPGSARLVISLSMQFEAGAQPDRGAGSPFPPIDARYPDLPTATWYLKADFELVYAEAAVRRRMMSISTHDRISGIPARVKVLEEFIDWSDKHEGVAFLRKDEIARFALSAPGVPREA